MAEERTGGSGLDNLTKAITVVSLVIGVFAAWKAVPIDAEVKRLQADTARLELAIKQADADLKNLESSRKITLELYQEVKKVIEKKDKVTREEDAVRVLVESLADDPFRWKLLQVLAIGATSPEVKQAAAVASRFYEDEAGVKSPPQAAPAPAASGSSAGIGIGQFNVDFFYCESKRASSEPLAKAALALKGKSDTGRWRARLLPDSINQQPGYGLSSSEIRFTPPDEKGVADALVGALRTKGVEVKYNETSYPTPNYVSVFICQ